jgi:hypothetical protein
LNSSLASTCLGTHPRFFPLFLFLPPCSATIGPTLLTGMGATTLARLPFRLGLGRVLDAIVIFRPLRPICTLVRTRILFALCMIWIFVCIFGYFDSWSLRGYIIYSFVGSIVNLCNCCYSIPPASRARSNVHEALGGAFPKRHHVDCGLIAIICKVPVLGRYKWYQSPGFVDTHRSSLPVG